MRKSSAASRRRTVACVLALTTALVPASARAQETRPRAVQDLWPSGQQPVAEIRDGCIVMNGKPYFRNYDHVWDLGSCLAADPGLSHLKVYRYFLLSNMVSLGHPSRVSAWELQQKGVEEGAKAPVVTNLFRQAAAVYRQKLLVSHYLNGLQVTTDRVDGYGALAPDELNARFAAFVSESATKLARLWKGHPALAGYVNAEEYWMPGTEAWQFRPPKATYVAWLARKYGTVEKLNDARGEHLASFEDAAMFPCPGGKPDGETPAHIDFYDFLLEDNTRRMALVYDAVRKENPGVLVTSSKGDFRADWHYAQACDIFSWLGSVAVRGVYCANNAQPRAVAEHFSRAFDCVHYDYCLMGRFDRPWEEGEKYAADLHDLGYPHTVTEVFEGMKSQWLEDYNNAYYHYFHPTKLIREMGGVVTTWAGTKMYVHPDGLQGPDIAVPPETLGMSRAFAWCQRAAPLFLPAQVENGNVAVLHSDRSYIVSSYWDDAVGWRDLPEALRRLHVPSGFIRDGNLDDLAKFGVLIAGDPARAASPRMAGAVKAFVARGGKLILMPGAFTMNDDHVRRPELRAEMEELAAVNLNDLPRCYNPVEARQRHGNIGNYDRIDSENWPRCLAMYRAALDTAGAKAPADVSADGGPEATMLLTLGVLKGCRYWLVGIASFDTADRTVTLRMNSLPAGTYEVVDVTGERPVIVPDKTAGHGLAPDPEYRVTRYVTRAAPAEKLRKTGLAGIEVKSGMGRVLLVRPAAAAVVVNCPDYEARAIAMRKVGADVVVPADASPAVKQAAESLARAIDAQGGNARTVAPAAVRIESTRFDAVIAKKANANKKPVDYSNTLAVFQNRPLATDRNLIVIGSEATNPLTKHLGAVDTFSYDKVFEKITAAHPGPGRGLIGVVESVNDPSFDPTDQTRDALLVGGSDDAGTVEAIGETIRILEGGSRVHAGR